MYMIGTEEYNNEIMVMNEASMICKNNKEIKFKSVYEECIKFCYSENSHMGVKGVLNHKNRQYITISK